MKIASSASCHLFLFSLASSSFLNQGVAAASPCLLSSSSCSVDNEGNKSCNLDVKVNLHAGELGYFHIEQCGDEVNPTLGIEKGVTYHFKQSDESNYYHPLGFAYYADGAHDDVDELEPGIVPPESSSSCANDMSCPAPMYLKNGLYLGEYSNNAAVAPLRSTPSDNFGLDDYEPEFFFDPFTWNTANYSVALKFDDDDFTDDIFYFCHIHQYMTGRIKFVDEGGGVLNEMDKPVIPYTYDMASDYDKECGTFNLDLFQLPHPECPSKFVCDKPDVSTPVGKFADCLDSMNCAMTVGMTTNVHMDSAIALFIHQMIPHHQNAVNMCKALMVAGEIECSGIGEDEEDVVCIMRRLCYEIINGQNFQIQTMRGVLDAFEYAAEDDCKVEISSSGGPKSPKNNKSSKNAKFW
eukprot:CAMPEP_0198147640 /NCGR_PEP_ID=MMETSP1443-20131203/36913_1 /TAXON_ID=186043 /ORGANISM="Entomoneis sp., Strain CCMP2396" /LENGTH=408 /DNA_ID=CAMNT_0043812053 /DNA_START=40 /DNA_END=1263 /DNA_ORIENTATION=-